LTPGDAHIEYRATVAERREKCSLGFDTCRKRPGFGPSTLRTSWICWATVNDLVRKQAVCYPADMAGLLDRMRKLIKTSRQSRHRISKGSGIAESSLSRFVNGKAVLTVETVERLADYFGLEIVLRPKRGRGARKDG